MQPMRSLTRWLENHASQEQYLFTLANLRALFPEMSNNAFTTLLSRIVQTGSLARVCRGMYMYVPAVPNKGQVLFHVAAKLRANEFNYISLETVLSDVGVISQVPINTISIMSSGRTNIIECKELGQIEFVHTMRLPKQIEQQLSYDPNCRMWRASVELAISDMKRTHRNCDLIDWELADELIRQNR